MSVEVTSHLARKCLHFNKEIIMEAKGIILDAFGRIRESVHNALRDLSVEELHREPHPPIGTPVEIGAMDIGDPGSTHRSQIVGDLVYVAAGLFGIHVIGFGPEYAQAPEPLPNLSLFAQLGLVTSMMAVGMWTRRARAIGWRARC